MRPTLVDTGPLIAFLNRRDRYHEWSREELSRIQPPLWTCESVLSEAFYLLGTGPGQKALADLLRRDLVQCPFQLQTEIDPVLKILEKYADVPASLADACLVRMAELNADCPILTLDSDFGIYRIHGKKPIPVIIPSR